MKKFKTWKSLLGLLLAMMMLLSACSAAAPAGSSGDAASAETAAADETQSPLQEEPAEQTQEQPADGTDVRMAVVFATNLGDNGFSDLVWKGMNEASEDLGIEIKSIELMGDATKQEPTLIELCESEEWDVIVAGTFNMKEAIQNVADEFPEQKFIVYDTQLDYSDGKYQNCVSVMTKQYEVAFMAGALAAEMTSREGEGLNAEKVVGFVGGAENSSIDDFLVGYIEGVKYVDADVQVLYSFVGDFKNTAKAKELALSQYQQGADIVFAVASAASLGVLDAAKAADAFAIGVDLDQAEQLEANDPEISAHIMTSAMKKLDTLLYNLVSDYLDGTITWGQHQLAGLSDGTMALADNKYFRAVVPQDVIDQIAQIEADIISGTIQIPTAIGMTADELQAEKDKA